MRQKFGGFCGFTLSEILLNLAVIGVVAMVALPNLIENVNGRVLEQQHKDFQTKIKEAANQMAMNNVLVGYTTNEAFANEFQKYMKVNMRCDSSNLTKCFPAKIKAADGTEIDTSTLTTGTTLKADNNTAPTVGFGLSNGTLMIIGLKALTGTSDDPCLKLDPMAGNTSASNTLSCMSILYDVNGLKGPNTMDKDINYINVSISPVIYSNIGGLQIASEDTPFSPINTCSTGTAEDQAFDPTGNANSYCANNNWAGAKKACAAIGGRLPNGGMGANELNTMYLNRASISGLRSDGYYWSATPYSGDKINTYAQDFRDGSQVFGVEKSMSSNEYYSINVRCIK